jgi:hypothetical protein
VNRDGAPIYVRAHDLSLALTFVAGRQTHLDGADRALARLKGCSAWRTT